MENKLLKTDFEVKDNNEEKDELFYGESLEPFHLRVIEGIRGLVADEDLKKNQILTINPIVKFDEDEFNILEYTKLGSYVFEWDEKTTALALGYGSLFNHSDNSNVAWEFWAGDDESDDNIVFYATKDIKKGKQLFLNYGYHWEETVKQTRRLKSIIIHNGMLEKLKSYSKKG